ncbi:MAG: thiamine pyrophosphate-dependent enzyme, partial [Desulfurococcales archaeon]|nr:thiamine pyrophosphate-dependent enzyme [Desulfurococcales archaeon]
GQGTHIVYTYDYIRVTKPGRFLAATNLGAMGYAFPAALGAKLAKPESEVIAVVGDGEFMMTVQDLETAVRENIPVKVVVVNDNSYRVLLLRQRLQKGGRIYGTLHSNPSFEALARVFGAEGATVSSDDDVDETLKAMLDSNKPFVVDLQISPEDLPPLNLEGSLRMSGG